MLNLANNIITSLINQTSVWSDFGFLLKVVRTNNTLSELTVQDDIDIGVCYYPNLVNDIDHVVESGLFEVSYIYINKLLTMIKISPIRIEGFSIDISVYYERISGIYETYMIFRPGWNQIGFQNLLSRFLLLPFYIAKCRKFYKWPTIIKTNFYFSRIFRVALIQVNKEFVIPTKDVRIDSLNLSFPKDTNSYLNGRYGDWRMKISDWVFNRDQRDLISISLIDFKKILKDLRAKNFIS